MARLLVESGLPPVAGRMWAWLLICEPEQQTAAATAEALHASRGSISSAARLLETAGLIRRTTRRGDRREYFSLATGSVIGLIRARLPIVAAFRREADHGLELLADRPPEQRTRLQELRDVYSFFEQDLPASLDRFLASRKDAPA